MQKKGMELSVWLVVLLGALVWWIKLADDIGKSPNEEIVTRTQEIDKRTGQRFEIEITKCGLCGETISWVRFNRFGLPVSGFLRRDHHCKVKPTGAGFAKGFDFFKWLEVTQKRLSRH